MSCALVDFDSKNLIMTLRRYSRLISSSSLTELPLTDDMDALDERIFSEGEWISRGDSEEMGDLGRASNCVWLGCGDFWDGDDDEGCCWFWTLDSFLTSSFNVYDYIYDWWATYNIMGYHLTLFNVLRYPSFALRSSSSLLWFCSMVWILSLAACNWVYVDHELLTKSKTKIFHW